MVSVLASSVVDHGLEPRSDKIGICCFSAKHAALRSGENKLIFNEMMMMSTLY
jgi:hypothetical protein